MMIENLRKNFGSVLTLLLVLAGGVIQDLRAADSGPDFFASWNKSKFVLAGNVTQTYVTDIPASDIASFYENDLGYTLKYYYLDQKLYAGLTDIVWSLNDSAQLERVFLEGPFNSGKLLLPSDIEELRVMVRNTKR